mmetsp:Transcript_5916/g.12468  ORF Transcript_5916/g.12468 Transcript_5916/m.12468 type:complete len:273 (-) Transcript_5916:372-1190(-)
MPRMDIVTNTHKCDNGRQTRRYLNGNMERKINRNTPANEYCQALDHLIDNPCASGVREDVKYHPWTLPKTRTQRIVVMRDSASTKTRIERAQKRSRQIGRKTNTHTQRRTPRDKLLSSEVLAPSWKRCYICIARKTDSLSSILMKRPFTRGRELAILLRNSYFPPASVVLEYLFGAEDFFRFTFSRGVATPHDASRIGEVPFTTKNLDSSQTPGSGLTACADLEKSARSGSPAAPAGWIFGPNSGVVLGVRKEHSLSFAMSRATGRGTSTTS